MAGVRLAKGAFYVEKQLYTYVVDDVSSARGFR